MSRLKILLSVAALAAVASCTESESATELNPAGPPMIRQVFMREVYTLPSGTVTSTAAIAFGEHPDFNEDDDGEVRTALVNGVNQKLRVVMDELLMGNYLEELQCRGGGNYVRIPEGTTPDDVARCSVAQDILPATCVGEFDFCMEGACDRDDADPICQVPCTDDAQCVHASREARCADNGFCTLDDLGIMDNYLDPDGAADDTRLIDGVVAIECDSNDAALDIHANVPISQTLSFWQPAGNQQVPAAGGFDAVGPAVIVQADEGGGGDGHYGMPTSSTCTIKFADSVVDKDHNRICAPPGGDPVEDCPADHDTTLVTWGTEPMRVSSTVPSDNASNVTLLTPDNTCPADLQVVNGGPGCARLSVDVNAVVKVADSMRNLPAGAITLLEGGTTPVTDARVQRTPNCPASSTTCKIEIYVPGGLTAGTEYSMVIDTALTDTYGIPLPEDRVTTTTFTTVAATVQ